MRDREDFELSVEISVVLEANFKTVWDNLHSINVNEHTESKGNLTYLSWAWAYSTMMSEYPTFSYRFLSHETHPDDTVTVHVECNITMGGVDLKRSMWLPVMDYRNKSVTNPNSMAINTSKMRCLTKCISMYGLGAYIYAGEDLPEEPTTGDAPKAKKATPKKAAPKKAAPKKAAPTKVTAIKPKVQEEDRSAHVQPVDKKVEDDGQDFYFADEEAAEEFAQFMITTATDMHGDSMENLVEFWRINIKATNYLTENFPDQYETVKNAFSELKAKLIGDDS